MLTIVRRLISALAVVLGLLAAPAQAQTAYPNMPAGLNATSMGDGLRVYVRWDDTSANETGFEIVRERAVGLTWTDSTTLEAGQDVTNLMDSAGAGTFRYRIRAVNGAGASAWTVWVYVTSLLTLPTVPTNLEAIDLGDGLRVQLRWTDASNNENGFEILRQKQTGPTTWGNDKTLVAPADTQVLNNVPGPGTFRYRIRSVNAMGTSAWSAWVECVVVPVTPTVTLPSAPTNPEAINLGTGNNVYFRWVDASNNEDGFTIERQWWNGSIWGAKATFVTGPNATNRNDTVPGPGNERWRYRVASFNAAGSSPFTTWVEIDALVTPPTVPTNLEAIDLGDGLRAQVRWTDASNNESGFEILREKKNAQGQWFGTTVLTAGANVQVINNVPGPGTFRYRIRSVNSAGTSAWSAWVTCVIDDTAPAAPTDLAVVSLGNGSQTRLTWIDQSSNESGFEIERQTLNGSLWTLDTMLSAPLNAVELTDAPGVGTHRYRVRAVNAIGPSPYTPWVQVIVAQIPPAAPTGITASSLNNGLQAQVGWQDNSNNETGFELERQTLSGSAWGSVLTIPLSANVSQYTDAPGLGTHRYRVRALNAAGPSSFTGWAQVVITAPTPTAPSNPAAVSLNNGLHARVTWQDNSNNETGFEVERQTQVGTVWGSTTTLNASANATQLDDPAGVGTHRYRVRAVNAAGPSAFTAWVSVTILTPLPAAPSNPAAVSLNNGTHARVTWQDNSNNETGFEVERETQSGTSWGSSATFTVSANVTQLDNAAGPGTHRFRIRAVNAVGASAYTAWATVTIVPAIPPAPSGLTGYDAGNRRAMINWVDNSSNETRFDIDRSPAFSGGFVVVSANVTGYLDQCGAGTFSYRVRAANTAGASAWTPWVQVVVSDIVPAAPSNVSAIDLGNQLNTRVTWTDNSDNETGFDIERQTNTGGNSWGAGVILTAPANATQLQDGPGPGTFRYRVRAVNTIGPSAWTGWATVSVTTGWTQFTPSADTRIVYVSSSQGNDGNTGLSEAFPKKTLAAGVSQLRHGYPDWLLLRRGDTWTNESLTSWSKSGRSITEPMVISTYGTAAARPLIRTGSGGGFARYSGGSPATVTNLAVVGLHFTPHLYNGTSSYPTGIAWFGPGENILFEDCLVEGYKDNVVIQADPSFETARNIRFRRCVILDAYVVGSSPHSQGMYVDGQDGFVAEECVFDHNGWREDITGAVQTVFRHNVYLQVNNTGNITFRRNIVTNGASNGLQARSGGLVEDNIFARNAMTIDFGGGDEPVPGGVTGVIRGNAIFEGTPIAGSPRGVAIQLFNVNAQGALVENNIIAHNILSPNSWALVLVPQGWGAGMGVAGATIRNNVIYDWCGGMQILSPQGGAVLTGVTIQSNILHEPRTGINRLARHEPASVSQAAFTFQNNRYFSAMGSNQWFEVGGTNMSFAQWVTAAHEVGSISAAASLVDPSRTLATYNASVGGAGTLAAFLAEARKQSRTNWRTEYTAQAVLQYLRAGYASN